MDATRNDVVSAGLGGDLADRSDLAAGFARGKANVQLIAKGDATLLKYDASATVGGKLAQLGGRLLDSSARALAREFFKGFRKVMSGEGEEEASEPREIAQ